MYYDKNNTSDPNYFSLPDPEPHHGNPDPGGSLFDAIMTTIMIATVAGQAAYGIGSAFYEIFRTVKKPEEQKDGKKK